MRTREQYVASLKKQLDAWSADIGRWEGKAREAQADIKERYERELAVLNAQRELARYNLRLVEGASLSAWAELRKGADQAWERMREAADAASGYFEKVPPKKMAAPAARKAKARPAVRH